MTTANEHEHEHEHEHERTFLIYVRIKPLTKIINHSLLWLGLSINLIGIDMAKLNYQKQTNVERGRAGVMIDRAEFTTKKAGNSLSKTDLHKTWLRVPYAEKDTVKALGGRWDATQKKWYCLGKTGKFTKWLGN